MRYLASLRITVVALVAMAALAVAGRFSEAMPHAWMAVPVVLLAANLAAALATNPRIRSRAPLALFHAGLLGVCLLLAASILWRFEGDLEIAEGTAFDAGAVRSRVVGPFSRPGFEDVSFVQGAVVVRYADGLIRDRIESAVVTGGAEVTTSDLEPLEVGGTRFTPTSNKGFALLLAWRGDDGTEIRGALHLPSYPVYEWRQENAWVTPAGEPVRIAFRPAERAPTKGTWTLSREWARGAVTVSAASGISELRPGGRVALRGGVLVLEDVRLWMGYHVERDPALPALFVVAALALLALAWHVAGATVVRAPRKAWGTVGGFGRS